MDCDQFVELVTEYLEGTLDPETERRVAEHLAECDGCGQYLEQIRQTVLALHQLPSQGLSDEARQSLLTTLRGHRSA
jgi:anti-sigma factor RsiW